ncbi:hypothetical protein [Catenovulum sediminis]|uniref:DUF4426 domain-containing protein n=1 Tax=Catenovulum sediminis TaxID=1740262 RepID=A0ABV1RCV8_9ALTE
MLVIRALTLVIFVIFSKVAISGASDFEPDKKYVYLLHVNEYKDGSEYYFRVSGQIDNYKFHDAYLFLLNSPQKEKVDLSVPVLTSVPNENGTIDFSVIVDNKILSLISISLRYYSASETVVEGQSLIGLRVTFSVDENSNSVEYYTQEIAR